MSRQISALDAEIAKARSLQDAIDKSEPSRSQIDQALAEAGLINIPAGGFKPLARATPMHFDDGGPTVSQTVIREREECERAIHGH